MSDLCVICGTPIPEGRQICPKCEKQTIKDSGDRTIFPTGAVRDMHQGKGRYDLIPWEAIHELALHCEAGALKYGERNVEKGIPISSLVDSAFRHLSKHIRRITKMIKRICPNCGKANFSADTLDDWTCYYCKSEIPKQKGEG